MGSSRKGGGTTFEEFVAQAQPFDWNSQSEMKLERWFEWPPDVFALSSLLLSYTGAYRRVVSPPEGQAWPEPGWPQKAHDRASRWQRWIAGGLEGPHPLSDYKATIQSLEKVPIDSLYDPPEGDAWDLFIALLELLSIADEAMRGVGSVFAPRTTLEIVENEQQLSGGLNLFYLQANFLLALRGSLSRIPKYRGIVVPKARTPQIGLTLRSFSNNLTFHQTEVDVVWRTFPWFNFDENTVNLMIVPWPFKVDARFFKSIPHPRASSQLGQDRYFHYQPRPAKGLDCKALVEAVKTAEAEVRRIHAVIFPEMALRQRELRDLKKELERELSPQHIPMIISGVSAQYRNGNGAEPEPAGEEERGPEAVGPESEAEQQTRDHVMTGPQARGFNRVVLSVYYAGKWHDLLQDKHHRWKLDGQQIEQYRLGGVLSGVRDWWEAIHVVRRRLSVLSANSWLAICPLICEDLARLEPVSELVRGIGPTLLIALLLDGPQMKERWSARYASVFADDPGSSVLTVTSLGMSKRSRIPGDVSAQAIERARSSAPIIGQWKDQEGNWYPIRVGESPAPAKVLTVGALWKTETAFDGRLDRESSAVFVYQGMEDYQLETDSRPPQDPESSESNERASNTEDDESPNDLAEREADAKSKKLKILDMCELTLFTFYTDALADATSLAEVDGIWSWFQLAVDCTEFCSSDPPPPKNELETQILDLLVYSIETRDLVPKEVPTPHLILAIQTVTEIVREALSKRTASASDDLGYWKDLADLSSHRMAAEHSLMANDLASLQADREPGRSAAEVSGYSAEVRDIAKDWLQRYRTQVDDSIVRFRGCEVGRIRLMAPLAVLWAIHARLTIQRRYGVLSSGGADLLAKIEELVDDRTLHLTYLDWRDELSNRETEVASGP